VLIIDKKLGIHNHSSSELSLKNYSLYLEILAFNAANLEDTWFMLYYYFAPVEP
jgi:hypothetical protein